jgi:primosomal protein N' (replication factor Y) (superfamily II helicase)
LPAAQLRLDGPRLAPTHVRVAVPAPVPDALTYAVPEDLDARVVPGVRVRVSMGRRKLVGVAMERTEDAPEGVTLKPILEVVDREPVLPPELLELARFTADYYLAPIGETVRAMLPSQLPALGSARLWLTSAGALARPRDDDEAAVVEVLREAGRISLGDLAARLPEVDAPRVVDRLVREGRLASGERRSRSTGVRYRVAVEVAPGALETHAEALGRSKKARGVVEYLEGLGRPALVQEVTDAVGCTDGVVRRLAKMGALRQFTQVERMSLDRHRMGASSEVGEGEPPVIVLRPDQREAADALLAGVETGEYTPFLLRGMTGSGKTEVYLTAAERVIGDGRSAILLVPEIALVPALARTLAQRFGGACAILHSSLSAGERHQEWERIRRGEARLVLGSRSAIFAPVRDLGLLVVDEEQDSAYKQDQTPRYNGRDLALVRGRAEGAVVVVVSATPSLESRHNAETGKLTALSLHHRAGAAGLPESLLVDLKELDVPRKPGEVTFSPVLLDELERAFAAGDQAILLRNRRGYSPRLLCRACGEEFRCEACGLPKTLHVKDRRLACHYCGDAGPVPRRCPTCDEAALEPMGAGTERVEERFAELFPDVAVDVLDRDAVRRPGGVASVLERFARGETRALVGTQMVAKGHHFPRVALAGVLSADSYLGFPDFRAVERTYNLLVQLAGRAGRGDRPGRVVIQTYHPQHYAIQAALTGDDDAFAAEEMRFRRVFHYPPYTRMVQLLVRDKDQDKARESADVLARALAAHPRFPEIRMAGPATAPMERIRHRWRYQILLRARSGRLVREVVRVALDATKVPAEVVVDVDPLELM